VQTTPRVRRAKIDVIEQQELVALLRRLEGGKLYVPVLLAASTGLRRGEVLGLRWADIDFNKGTLQVGRSVELVGRKLSVKKPNTERSRRVVTIPENVLSVLKAHRKGQAEICLKLGIGRVELVFPHWPDGGLQDPRHFTKAFTRAVKAAGIKPVTFHGLRHSHITALLRSGMPLHVVSARAGHASPNVTLGTYAHLLEGDDRRAAAVRDELLKGMIKDRDG
jgi:integrase